MTTQRMILVPWSETAWHRAGRLVGVTPLALTAEGRETARLWGDALRVFGLSTVVSSEEQAGVETGRIIADACQVTHQPIAELSAMNVGLWAGLSRDELKRRYPRVFKRWMEDPSAVCPPEGEELESCARRVESALKGAGLPALERLKALVLEPLVSAVARCILEQQPLASAHRLLHDAPLLLERSDLSLPFRADPGALASLVRNRRPAMSTTASTETCGSSPNA